MGLEGILSKHKTSRIAPPTLALGQGTGPNVTGDEQAGGDAWMKLYGFLLCLRWGCEAYPVAPTETGLKALNGQEMQAFEWISP